MKKFKADYVFPVNADPIKNGIITVDDSGLILAITDGLSDQDHSSVEIEKLEGIICPGFINAHCHVELSHLRDKIEPKTGLINFIKQVQGQRNATKSEDIQAAAQAADDEMYRNGIVAVGDISNSADTIGLKTKSKIYYHTFIEVFGFVPQKAEEIYNKALALRDEFTPLSCSVTPHAPYSVSKELFKCINKLSQERNNLISIHNQESAEENKLYRYKMGNFIDLYNSFNIDISFFRPQARNSIQTMVPLLTNKQNILLVHNTFTNLKDIYFVKRFDRKIHWCFCPNANLYIEDQLPKIELFLDQGFNITLGTDSLASNRKLCILNEMLVLQQNFSSLTFEKILPWATLNGAKFLGIADEKGTIEVGKTPGLNLITGLDNFQITPQTKVQRLI
ncbi:cytosine/adenosine deaminase-related metal-dependent hydrolase [Mucilaginibacter gracilis]|uniref:Cytosine/adenosine deaminase-related metal-dependent hydrolase n=1 Tax=Mucilaginibacter gracilis TaxID=423350 RepID=A0A495JAT1_9SPHI|nr:amidohydrolase family protein [Mucilaginibacter gracilis]RKR85598.1 cytosine/adenosine deaminase-related metal-dependent hydrolase [Mucilaginibacter gracilis]